MKSEPVDPATVSIAPVIICGGKGTRLWPLSRNLYPKQFIEITQGTTLFRDTLRRLAGVSDEKPIVVCNQEHRFMAAEQLRAETMEGSILLEPMGRNTAPAVAVAALQARPEQVLLVMPADHSIDNGPEFRTAIQRGATQAMQGDLVCFGIVPGRPETGYGYIHRGERLEESVYTVHEFVEKPDLERAREYLESGEFCWNSGIFMFRADRYLEELGRFAPDMLAACSQAMEQAREDLDFIRLDEESFAACPSDSIDYAVMEKTASLCMVELNARWSDLGSWTALHDIADQDDKGNTMVGDVVCQDVENSYLYSGSRLVTAIGLKNAVVVETADAVLVSDGAQIQNVKSIVAALRQANRTESEAHPMVYRPWGSFQSIISGPRFQVKLLRVKPGEILSQQKHFHRAEHWIVVSGTALVHCGDREILLREDESTYIPLGNIHRLANPGKVPLEIIEVQTGTYLGEDDIVRFEDKYAR